MDEMEKYEELWNAVHDYFMALKDEKDLLRILEARSRLARLVNYGGDQKNG